jgi:hypothetical protein
MLLLLLHNLVLFVSQAVHHRAMGLRCWPATSAAMQCQQIWMVGQHGLRPLQACLQGLLQLPVLPDTSLQDGQLILRRLS